MSVWESLEDWKETHEDIPYEINIKCRDVGNYISKNFELYIINIEMLGITS